MPRLLLILLLAALPLPAFPAQPPNVVVILSDDQGWGDFSLHGNRDLQTPNLDSLARQGARFDRFFVCAVCSPTRAEFLTGRYHPRGGVFSTSTGGERLDLDETTIAQVFQEAGYATAAFGKWHNGMQPPYHPNARGFGEFYGFCSGHWGHYYSPPLEHNGELVRGNGFLTDDFTDRALEFISRRGGDPFFVYLAYCTPHSPMQVPDPYWERFEGRELEMLPSPDRRQNPDHTRAALAMCENIDWNVGRILQHLERNSLAENTIVAYFNDNGPNGHRWNGGMKGRKGSTDEGGVRSPLFLRWPARIRPGTRVEHISGAIDLLPTLAALAGIEPRPARPLDGRSLEPLLLGSGAPWPERLIFSRWRDRTSVRSQRFRLDAQGALFDMASDPGQTRDVRREHPGIHRELVEAVERWDRDVGKAQGEPRPFTVGHPGFRFTQLPARDAVPHGNIERSARAPNCSFLENWISTEDYISWDAEVLHPGRFLVDVHYTCRPEDVGTVLRLTFGESALEKEVRGSHHPPLIGAGEDRSVRVGESYVKDFRPLRMGVIELEEGRGELRLQAASIPGERSIDFRLMMLTRIPD